MVSVWLIGWLVSWLVDTPQGLKVIGSSAPSAAHLAQGMSQLLHCRTQEVVKLERRCSRGAESQEVLLVLLKERVSRGWSSREMVKEARME